MSKAEDEKLKRALAGDKGAMIALAMHRLHWGKKALEGIGRGNAEAVALCRAELEKLLPPEPIPNLPRSLAPIEPVIVGDHDEATIEQLRRCLDHDDALAGAICADGHLGYSQPVGGVVAYREHISISGVGYDIACGNMAVKTDLTYSDVVGNMAHIMDHVAKRISFGVGRKNDTRVESGLFDHRGVWEAADALDLRDMARDQLGTVGSGNHYVDIFRETSLSGEVGSLDAPVWIGVHFGSRGLGHKLATRYLKRAGGKDGIHQPPTLLHQDSDLGKGYLAAMELAGRYAYAGREWVVNEVLSILGAQATYGVHNHHNFAWREEVEGAPAWVVRKGCTPAFIGQEGFVGGSMGDDAVILEGAGDGWNGLLQSTVHGAGRICGRKEAKRRFTRAEMDAWLTERGVVLRGADLDESPMAYRRLEEVLAHHGPTIRVKHRLRPVGVAMAGDGEFDPYKD